MFCKSPRQFRKISSEVAFPCGDCLPCRINKRRVWAHRLMLESQYHQSSIFLTLTYSDDNLPGEFYHDRTGQIYPEFSVNPDHHRLFMNNLRTSFARETGQRIRFYGVGEYGEKTMRPHYHYALFGFPECTGRAYYFGGRFNPCKCPSCSFISRKWDKGHIFSGSLTLDSANYIAGYVTKKLTSDKCYCKDPSRHHHLCSQVRLAGRFPEFSRASRRPGLAYEVVDDIIKHLTYTTLSHTVDDVPRLLVHGSKALPLGRYLTDKIYEKMGITFEPGEKLQRFEQSLRSMLLSSETSTQVKTAYSGSVAIALQLLNSQRVLNLESKNAFFKKEMRI